MEHFLIGTCGELFDTRLPNWSDKPLRKVFSKHFGEIANLEQFKATLRAGEFTNIGAYPLYFTTRDGAAICYKCAKSTHYKEIAHSIMHQINDGFQVTHCGINYEFEFNCECCDSEIESAY